MRTKLTFGAILLSLCLLISTGCQEANTSKTAPPILSIAQIEQIAKNKFDTSIHGEITIIETKLLSNGQYQVKWKRPQNCESGTEHFDQTTGENVSSVHTIC